MKMCERNYQGFTLVELAIVMVVIGLLIGGILKGTELVENAKLNNVISQIKSTTAAMHGFKDKYNGTLPGDYINASISVPNCTAENFCVNGNGDSVVGLSTPGSELANQTGASFPRVETSMFWKHLALSDFISGIDTNANPALPAAGETHPAIKVGGVIMVSYKLAGGSTSVPPGMMAVLSSRADRSNTQDLYTVSPQEAAQIDRKMDDGIPNSGIVWAEPAGSGCKTRDGAGGVYNEDRDDKICILFFRLGR